MGDKTHLARREFLTAISVSTAAAFQVKAAGSDKQRSGLDNPSMPNFIQYGYDQEPYPLAPGPHLFVDYRYIQPGWTRYVFPDGSEAPRYGGDASRLGSIIGIPKEMPRNFHIEAQRAQKLGIVLENDRAWEYRLVYRTLLHWSGKYRFWYEVEPPRDTHMGRLLCYAESDDGLLWTKPNLGLVEFNGSKQNNIVYGAPVSGHSLSGCSVFVDPQAPPSERLKVIYMSRGSASEIAAFKAKHPDSVSPIGERKRRLIRLGQSADGIHWTPRPNPVMSHMSDTQTTAYYDQILRRYVGFFRLSYMNHRAIGRTESASLEAWPIPKVALFPEPQHDRPGDDYYISGYSRYPGTTTMHLMLATIYRRLTDTAHISLASSMDGAHWTWVPGPAAIEPGPDGAWDGGYIFGGINLTELPDGRVVSPYAGYRYPHKFPRYARHMGRIGLAAWPAERLSAVVAEEEGHLVTIPLSSPRSHLFLNFQTTHNGYIKVGVENLHQRTIEKCFRLSGDHLKKKVTWRGADTIGVPPGKSFSLRFNLRAAKLYSFELR